MAPHTQRLGRPIDSAKLRAAHGLLRAVGNHNVKRIVGANAVLVALVLRDVYGASAGCEARGAVLLLEVADAEGDGADGRDAAFVVDGGVNVAVWFAVEVAVLLPLESATIWSTLSGSQLLRLASWITGWWRPSSLSPSIPPAMVYSMETEELCRIRLRGRVGNASVVAS
jgi:hypothetical protein